MCTILWHGETVAGNVSEAEALCLNEEARRDGGHVQCFGRDGR